MATAKKPEVYVALLRGINVGGNNSLPMKDLAQMFERAGCSHVKTYIQSGNVIFKADTKLAQQITSLISKAILKDFEIAVPVIIRSAQEILKVSQSKVFGKVTEKIYVAFLAHNPTKAALQSLDPNRSPGDEFKVVGSHIYLNFSQGAGKTKLTNQYFDSKLATVSTIRNWNTVLKLAEMTQE